MNDPLTFTFRETILVCTALAFYKKHAGDLMGEGNEVKTLHDRVMAAYHDEDDDEPSWSDDMNKCGGNTATCNEIGQYA